jgi:hypothetical protein
MMNKKMSGTLFKFKQYRPHAAKITHRDPGSSRFFKRDHGYKTAPKTGKLLLEQSHLVGIVIHEREISRKSSRRQPKKTHPALKKRGGS